MSPNGTRLDIMNRVLCFMVVCAASTPVNVRLVHEQGRTKMSLNRSHGLDHTLDAIQERIAPAGTQQLWLQRTGSVALCAAVLFHCAVQTIGR